MNQFEINTVTDYRRARGIWLVVKEKTAFCY